MAERLNKKRILIYSLVFSPDGVSTAYLYSDLVLGFKNKAKNSFLINEVIEKPKLSEAPSNYAIIGRYILPMKILSVLKNQGKGKGGEIHITDAIKTLIKRLVYQENKSTGYKLFSISYFLTASASSFFSEQLNVHRSVSMAKFSSAISYRFV